jgi:hypothetical protein
MTKRSPEHVLPRSTGDARWIVDVHPYCNARANQLIDTPLIRCRHLRAARAEARIAPYRSEHPYEETLVGETVLMVRVPVEQEHDHVSMEEVLERLRSGAPYAGPGGRVRVSLRGDEVAARFLPNPIYKADGSIDVFENDDGREPEPPPPDFEPIDVLAVAKFQRRCSHPPDTWKRFTAKVGLALLHECIKEGAVLEDGFPLNRILPVDAFSELGSTLRRIAFSSVVDESVPPGPYTIRESQRAVARHTVGLLANDGNAEVIIQLFQSLTYRVTVSDIPLLRSIELSVALRAM